MKAYETSATVENQGQVRLTGVPFAPGTEVEVTISAKRRSAEEFTAAWRRVCAQLRDASALPDISDEAVQSEIDDYRDGR